MFSKSYHRLICYFLCLLESYFERNRLDGISFRVFIHENRQEDLARITRFWSES
jgi:hypothetical protein